MSHAVKWSSRIRTGKRLLGQLGSHRWSVRTDSVEWQKQKPVTVEWLVKLLLLSKNLEERREPRRAVALDIKARPKKNVLWWERFEYVYIRSDGASRQTGIRGKTCDYWRNEDPERQETLGSSGEGKGKRWFLGDLCTALFLCPASQSSSGW